MPSVPAHDRVSNAFEALGTDDPRRARAQAKRELARGPRCLCCLSPRVHLSKFVGSLLFLDDNPELLHRALPAADWARFTVRTIAACIVLYGRARVELHERR
jgi:hypothetical protein